MSNFLPPTTVSKTLAAIQQNRFVLPAIQREFVWSGEQVCTLFDSLLRGYPIGSFLFWQVDGKQAQDFRYYTFLTDYHELKNPHASVAHIPVGSSVTAPGWILPISSTRTTSSRSHGSPTRSCGGAASWGTGSSPTRTR